MTFGASEAFAMWDRQRDFYLSHVSRLRRRGAKPVATWRCHRGCLLLAAYATPEGTIWHTPTARVSPRAAHRTAARHVLQGLSEETEAGALLTGERAGAVTDDGQDGVPIVCKHTPVGDYMIGAPEIRERVAAALSDDTPRETVLRHSGA